MTALVDATVIGLFGAAPLVLAAVGFTLIYYLNGFINVAYAENVTVGAYVAVVFNTILGWNFYLTIVPSAVIAGLLSVATFVLVFRPAMRRGVGPTEMIILSVGLSFFIRFGLRVVFGIKLRLFDTGKPAYLDILGIGITDYQVAALVLAAAVVVGLYLFIFRTGLRRADARPGGEPGPREGERDRPEPRLAPHLVHRRRRGRPRRDLLRRLLVRERGHRLEPDPGRDHDQHPRPGRERARGARRGRGRRDHRRARHLQVSQPLYAQVVLLLLFIVVLKFTRTAPAMRG